MATGIQTGLGRTGTGIAPPGKPPSPGGIGKILATWTGLNPKTRIIAMISVIAILVIGVSAAVLVKNSAYVELYAFKLNETDQKEILAKLTTDNDPYEVVAGKILVPPDKRQKLAAYLMEYGLPHRSLEANNPDAGGGMIPPSDKEKEAIALQKLQAKLIEQMRVLSYVADAYVEIVPEDEEAALTGSAKPATAQVLLQLKPGKAPTREQVDAIVSMVAYSVRGLDANNVKVMTDDGKILSKPTGGGDTAKGPGASDASLTPTGEEDLALKSAVEKQYRDKVLPSLDKIFGPDRYTLNVDADIDFSQKKIESETYGDAKQAENATKTEDFNNGTKDAPAPPDKKGSIGVGIDPSMAGAGATGKGGNNTNYKKSEIKTKYAINKTVKTVIVPAGAVRKVTAALSVDRNLTEDQSNKWEKWLKTSMGIDESRGDSVVVMAAAFANVAEVLPLTDKMKNYHETAAGDGPITAPVMVAMTAGSVLVLLTLIGVFLMKQHKVSVDKSALLLSTGNSTHTSEITDLLNEKSGKSTANTQTTSLNNRAELEKLAKEKPTRVAELLKSTWLSEKER